MSSLEKAVQILDSFSYQRRKLSLADLNRITGLPKSTMQRILSAMVADGLLVKDDENKTYELGMKLFFLGQLVESSSSLLSSARPTMQRIHDETGEAVSLSIIDQLERRCIGCIASRHELSTLMYVGQTASLHSGASAKALFAFLPPKERESKLNKLELKKITDYTITDRDALIKELDKVRVQGYAISRGERVDGAFSISCPIFNQFDYVVASLSLVIPFPRVDESKTDRWVNMVREGAKEITMCLRGEG